jgi:hypothetical protein
MGIFQTVQVSSPLSVADLGHGMQTFLRKEGWAYLLENRIILVLQQTRILYFKYFNNVNFKRKIKEKTR